MSQPSPSLEDGEIDEVAACLNTTSIAVHRLAVRNDGMNVLVVPHRDCKVLKTMLKHTWVPLDEMCTAAGFASTYVHRLASCRHAILRTAAMDLLRARPGHVYADSSVGDIAQCLYVMCIVIAHRISRRGINELEYREALRLVNKHSVRDAAVIEMQIGVALGWRFGPVVTFL